MVEVTVKEVKLSSNKVAVTGSASVISKIKKLKANILLNGFESADVQRTITPILEEEIKVSADSIKIEPNQILAKVKIETKKSGDENVSSFENTSSNENVTENKARKNLMSDVLLPAGQTSIKEILPKNLLVTVEGDKEVIDKLNNNSIKIKLDVSRIKGGKFEVKSTDFELPDFDLKVVEFSPKLIDVKF